MEAGDGELFVSMTLAEFCKRSSMPRATIERYLVATNHEHLLRGRQLLIHWEWLASDLPAFRAYIDFNKVGRPELEIASRVDVITAVIWNYALLRNHRRRSLTQDLRRTGKRLLKVQSKTSPDEVGERVSAAMKNFPYLEAGPEYSAALEEVRPHCPPTVSEEIAVIDLMIKALAKRGPRGRPDLKRNLVEKLSADHEWLTGRNREEHGARFRDFVKLVIETPMNARRPGDLRTQLTVVGLLD